MTHLMRTTCDSESYKMPKFLFHLLYIAMGTFVLKALPESSLRVPLA
jgi:hypothetical protein